MTRLKGSKLLGQWIASEHTTVLERVNSGRTKDAVIFLKLERLGVKIAVFPIKHKAGDAGKSKSRTAARKAGMEAWPIPSDMLMKCRRWKPQKIVLFLTDHDDYWLSDYADWTDPEKRRRKCSRSRKADLILLPSQYMTHVPAHKVLH